MKISTLIFGLFTTAVLITSCGNEIEEITNPSSGKLLKRFEYYTDDFGQKIKDGEYFEWDYLGGKVSELHYKDDVLNGHCIYFNKDGTIAKYNNLMGEADGEQTLQTEEGKLLFKENYTKGTLNGTQTYYHQNGKEKCSGNYTLGKQVGIWKYFNENGKSAFNLKYKNGICQNLEGTWISESGLTTFILKKDEKFIFKAPYFRYSQKAVVQGQGIYSMNQTLKLVDENNGKVWEYEVFDVSKEQLILINPNAEIEESILRLKKVN